MRILKHIVLLAVFVAAFVARAWAAYGDSTDLEIQKAAALLQRRAAANAGYIQQGNWNKTNYVLSAPTSRNLLQLSNIKEGGDMALFEEAVIQQINEKLVGYAQDEEAPNVYVLLNGIKYTDNVYALNKENANFSVTSPEIQNESGEYVTGAAKNAQTKSYLETFDQDVTNAIYNQANLESNIQKAIVLLNITAYYAYDAKEKELNVYYIKSMGAQEGYAEALADIRAKLESTSKETSFKANAGEALNTYIDQTVQSFKAIGLSLPQYIELTGEKITVEDVPNLNDYAFCTPNGQYVKLPKLHSVRFDPFGHLTAFELENGSTFGAIYSVDNDYLYGYWDNRIPLDKGVLTAETIEVIRLGRFEDFEIAWKGHAVLGYGERFEFDRSTSPVSMIYREPNCECAYRWTVESTVSELELEGTYKIGVVPDDAIRNCKGTACNADLEGDGVNDGPGVHLYVRMQAKYEGEEREKLVELANMLSDKLKDKRFNFYLRRDGPNAGIKRKAFQTFGQIDIELTKFLIEKDINSIEEFEEHFIFNKPCRNYDVVISDVDLWDGVPEGYNRFSTDYTKSSATPYVYSFLDLKVRYELFLEPGRNVVRTYVWNTEVDGKAEPIHMKEGYDQYVARFGTNSAFYFIAETMVETMGPVMQAFFAYQLIGLAGPHLTRMLIEKKGRDFFMGAMIDGILQMAIQKYFIQEEEKTFQELLKTLDAKSMFLSGAENVLISSMKKYEQLTGISFACLNGGIGDFGEILEGFDIDGCANGILYALFINRVSHAAFEGLKRIPVDRLKEGFRRIGNFSQQQIDDLVRWVKDEMEDASQIVARQLDEFAETLRKKYSKVADKFDAFDDLTKQKFYNDFSENSDEILSAFQRNDGLVDSWDVAKINGLPTNNIDYLQVLNSRIKNTNVPLTKEFVEEVVVRAEILDEAIGTNEVKEIIAELLGNEKFINHEDLLKNLDNCYTNGAPDISKLNTQLNEFREGQYWLSRGEEIKISKELNPGNQFNNEVDGLLLSSGGILECKYPHVTGANATNNVYSNLELIIKKFTTESKLTQNWKDLYPQRYGQINIANGSFRNVKDELEFVRAVKDAGIIGNEPGVSMFTLDELKSLDELHIIIGEKRLIIEPQHWD